MEEGQKHIDDFFREELGNYTEMPPEKVWEDLSQRLDDSRRPRFWGWWPWIVMLLLIGSVAGYMVLSKKNDVDKPANTVAVVDNGVSVSSNGLKDELKAESTKPKAESEKPKAHRTQGDLSRGGTAAQSSGELNSRPKAESEKPKAHQTQGSLSHGGTAAESSGEPNSKPKAESTKQKAHQPQGDLSHGGTVAQKTGADNATTSDAPAATNAANTNPNAKSKAGNKKTAGNTTVPATEKNATKANAPTATEDQQEASPKNTVAASQTAPKAEGKKQTAGKTKAPVTTTAATVVAANATSNQKTQSKSAPANEVSNNHTTAPKQIAKNTTTSSPDKPIAAKTSQPKVASADNAAKKQNTATSPATNAKTKPATNQTAIAKTTKTAPTPVDNKKPTFVAPAAETAKKPLPQPKPQNAVAKAPAFQPTPNPVNPLLMKPAEDSKKTAAEEKDDEDDGKAAMNDDEDENDSKPQQPQPAAEHDPRAGIPVSGYIDKAVPPQPKIVDDEDDTVDKKKVDLQNPAGGAGGSMSPSVGKDHAAISRLEGGAKFGFEKGFSSVTSNKWVATIYLQYNLSPKAAFLIQPSVKFAQMNKSINSSQSFYNVTGTTVSSTQRMDSISNPPFFDTVYNYYYKQTYDSTHVTQSSTKNYVEFEIPVIFKYTIAKNLSLLAGITMNFGSIPTVSSSQTTYSGLTLQDSVMNVHNNPNYQISVNDSFHHTAAPYSSYNANDQNPSTNPIRFGYLLGMNYLLKDRVLFDLTVQQSFSNMSSVPNADIRKVLTQPYVRFSVGYKIFQGKKKTAKE